MSWQVIPCSVVVKKIYKLTLTRDKMESMQMIGAKQIEELMKLKREEVANMAKEIAESEWDLFELKLFVSSFGKDHLDGASSKVMLVKKMHSNKEINLVEYEKLAEEL